MNGAYNTFEASLARVRSIHALHASISVSATPIADHTDLLRAEIVLLVSALDQFIHELTRIGMLDIWNGTRSATDAHNRFQMSLETAKALLSSPGTDSHLDNEIRLRHGFLAFQHPDKIADAIRLISSIELWNEVGALLGEPPADVKAQLKLLAERRNKIAHEADVDPSYPGLRWPIDRNDAELATELIGNIGVAIYLLVL